jgi:hypothetical protein
MTRKISYNNSYQSEAKLVNLDGSINFSDECVGGVEADRSSQEPRRNRTTVRKYSRHDDKMLWIQNGISRDQNQPFIEKNSCY